MRKTIILFVTSIVCALGLMSFTGATSVVWKTDVVDAGEIPQGKPKSIEFEFKNNGTTPIIITSAKGTCGCTIADYPKDPIAPGKTAKVTATYNAAAKGPFTKTVTVTTSESETPKLLTLKGTVI